MILDTGADLVSKYYIAYFLSYFMVASSSSRSDRSGANLRGTTYSPLYRQIKALLLKSLDQGEWKPGEVIPSEIELAARFDVSQGTVRKAIDELAAEHLLIRRQGKGTFVATHHEAKVRFRFLRLAPDTGQALQSESRVLSCIRDKAPADVAELLALPVGDDVVNLKRLLLFQGAPTIAEDIWLPGAAFQGLSQSSLPQPMGPLYAYLESEYGVSMVRAEEKIKAVTASEDQARILEIAPGSPLLFVERISFTYHNRPMEVRRGFYDTENFHYRNRLN